MKYWKESRTDNGYGPIGLVLMDHNNFESNARVLSLYKQNDGSIEFLEECDGYYYVLLSKEHAIEALQEAIDWIKE